MAKTNKNDNLTKGGTVDSSTDITALSDDKDITIFDASAVNDSSDIADTVVVDLANNQEDLQSATVSDGGDSQDNSIDSVSDGELASNDAVLSDNDADSASTAALPYTLNEDDIGDEPPLSYIERVELAMANRPKEVCTRDGAKDEKLSKYSTIACIPFFIAGIVVTIFNKAKYRSPWAFLLIGLAVFALAIGSWLRYRNNKQCTCSVCETQAKNLRNSVILWGALGVCCMIAFAIFLVINLRAGVI